MAVTLAPMSLHRLVERFPAPTEDEHVRALFHEPLGDGEPDAARAAADDGDLACQSRHDASFRLRPRLVRGGGTTLSGPGLRVELHCGPGFSDTGRTQKSRRL